MQNISRKRIKGWERFCLYRNCCGHYKTTYFSAATHEDAKRYALHLSDGWHDSHDSVFLRQVTYDDRYYIVMTPREFEAALTPNA